LVVVAACGGASAAGSKPTATSLVTAGAGAGAGGATGPTAPVGVINFKFAPPALSIKAGTTVVWVNHDAIAHSINFSAGDINSDVLNQNDQFKHTFSTPGRYAYICSIHPFMHGSVTVTS
jgi:amicyanin